MEELNKATEEMKKQLRCDAFEDARKPQKQRYLDVRRDGMWLTWIPWVFLPIYFVARAHLVVIASIGLLAVLTIVGAILPLEATLSGLATILGLVMSIVLVRMRQPNNEAST